MILQLLQSVSGLGLHHINVTIGISNQLNLPIISVDRGGDCCIFELLILSTNLKHLIVYGFLDFIVINLLEVADYKLRWSVLAEINIDWGIVLPLLHHCLELLPESIHI